MVEAKSFTLTYLDTDLYVSSVHNETFPAEFECPMCTGVVLEPIVQCTECETIYCRKCLASEKMPCPKRCGSNNYSKINRLVLNQLNKLKFKCQYHPNCSTIIEY